MGWESREYSAFHRSASTNLYVYIFDELFEKLSIVIILLPSSVYPFNVTSKPKNIIDISVSFYGHFILSRLLFLF